MGTGDEKNRRRGAVGSRFYTYRGTPEWKKRRRGRVASAVIFAILVFASGFTWFVYPGEVRMAKLSEKNLTVTGHIVGTRMVESTERFMDGVATYTYLWYPVYSYTDEYGAERTGVGGWSARTEQKLLARYPLGGEVRVYVDGAFGVLADDVFTYRPALCLAVGISLTCITAAYAAVYIVVAKRRKHSPDAKYETDLSYLKK